MESKIEWHYLPLNEETYADRAGRPREGRGRMRNAFVDELTALAAEDERVMLLTGDLGFMVLEEFQKRFPDRFVNCGRRPSRTWSASPPASPRPGFRPFVYSIATFSALRPYEFIRNGPALHNLPVRIVGVGGGFDYGHNGITHFALEDYAVMRAQPRIATVVPRRRGAGAGSAAGDRRAQRADLLPNRQTGRRGAGPRRPLRARPAGAAAPGRRRRDLRDRLDRARGAGRRRSARAAGASRRASPWSPRSTRARSTRSPSCSTASAPR